MANNFPPSGKLNKPYRKTLRLTFQVSGGEVRLARVERLDMICPPSIGATPEAGKHSGYWMELRDSDDRVLFHRLLHSPLADSVEVHSPDGKIQRVFGPPQEGAIFEVLLPDTAEGNIAALIGESLQPGGETAAQAGEREQGSRELARFEIPRGDVSTSQEEVKDGRE